MRLLSFPSKGLVASSNQNGSTKEGFILFICGNYKPKANEESTQSSEEEMLENDIDNDVDESKGKKMTMITINIQKSLVLHNLTVILCITHLSMRSVPTIIKWMSRKISRTG